MYINSTAVKGRVRHRNFSRERGTRLKSPAEDLDRRPPRSGSVDYDIIINEKALVPIRVEPWDISRPWILSGRRVFCIFRKN